MKVAELIQELQQLPQDARVIVAGYEGGYSDVDGAGSKPIRLNVHKEWYYGPHDEPEYGGDPADETAVLIG